VQTWVPRRPRGDRLRGATPPRPAAIAARSPRLALERIRGKPSGSPLREQKGFLVIPRSGASIDDAFVRKLIDADRH
jgi:hypothetical protein